MERLNQQVPAVKIPYPVIFIHGLISSSATWSGTTSWMSSAYGFTYGGQINFCLNYDGNYQVANCNFSPLVGADIASFTSPSDLIAGDFYCINFDMGQNGSVFPSTLGNSQDVESNQSAVAKQGAALSRAIAYVLQVTGRDKVVLLGHSMGGLASRFYLQNPSLWQADGKHHVAKLVTTGTPHGGSNASLSFLDGIATIDNESEAVRDLRTSYFYSGAPGVSLFGGLESNSVMNDVLCCYFENIDVNCNGIVGDSIMGLNKKPIDTTIDYGCIIGTGDPIGGGDYVVSSQSANINNYFLNLTPNTFSVSVIHTSLPDQSYQNMQGLDEPNRPISSYDVVFDTTYLGFTTVQAVGSDTIDHDYYAFQVTTTKTVTVNVWNIVLQDLALSVSDAGYLPVGNVIHSAGRSAITYSLVLNPGKYYVNIFGSPTLTSYLSPYSFELNTANVLLNGISSYIPGSGTCFIYPNPTPDKLTIQIPDTDLQEAKIQVFNSLGQLLIETPFTMHLALESLSPGMYILKINRSEHGTCSVRFIKE